jgi:hypothetical protein
MCLFLLRHEMHDDERYCEADWYFLDKILSILYEIPTATRGYADHSRKAWSLRCCERNGPVSLDALTRIILWDPMTSGYRKETLQLGKV